VRVAHVFILAAVVAFAATPAQAQVTIGGFTIGGTSDATFIDTGGNIVQITDKGDNNVDGFGNASELGPTNGTNTKLGVIHAAAPTMLSSTNPNPGVDLRRIWLGSSLVNNEGYLYFAWERDSKNGSGVVMFEFQQDPVPTGCNYSNLVVGTCNPWSGRQPGDFLIVWDQQGSTISIIKRTFMLNDANGNNTWDPGIDGLVLDAGVTLSGDNVKAATSPDGFKGEAAINLSKTIFLNVTGKCLSIANVIPGTVTGNSDTADYKDTLLFPYPDDVAISSCGKVRINKDSGTGLTGSFPYTFTRASGPMKYSGETIFTDTFNGHYADETGTTGTTNSPVNGFAIYDDIIAGTNYQLTEGSLTGGWSNTSIICKVPADGTVYNSGDIKAGGTAQFEVKINVITTCTILNVQVPRTLSVKKIVVSGFGLTAAGSDFQYTLTKNSVPTTGLTFLDLEGVQTYNIAVGTTYNVTETTQRAGWAAPQYSAGCSGTIQANADPTCTVTNTAQINDSVNVATRQLVILQDKAILTGLRRGTGEGAASVDFKLFSDAGCQAQVGTTQNVPVNWGADTTSTTITVGPAGAFTIERTTTATVNAVRYWTARYSGNAFNNARLTDCAEVTTINLAP
jgi:hypothetical protein